MACHKNNILSRRKFLKCATSAAAGIFGFPYIVSTSAMGKAGSIAPSDRIVMGFIGVGPRGRDVMDAFMHLPGTQAVAVCDVKSSVRQAALQQVNEHYGKKVCVGYNDFRELLVRPDIDAVSIASTDHWHVLHAVESARASKDMYVEKPLGLSVEQGKILRETIKHFDRVFQFGTQQRSSQNFRFACELVLNGRIGKVHTIKVGSPASHSSENYPPMSVPDGLDYEKWLGPAPWVPYTENRVINEYWWHISDYALGFVAGWGIHHIDIAQWGNGTELSGPVEIEGTGVFPQDGLCNCAVSWNVNFKYADGVETSYTDNKQNKQGVVFEGMQGWIYVKRGLLDASPKSLLQEVIGPDEIHLPVSSNHQLNFLESVKSRGRTVSPIEVAVRSDTICHLSDIAMRLGRKLKWNPDKEQFINDVTANRMLKRAMRSPWRLQ